MSSFLRVLTLCLLVFGVAGCASKQKSTTANETAGSEAKTAKSGKATTAATAGTKATEGGDPATNGKVMSELQCTNSSDNRTLAIFERGQGGCDLVYTKFGEGKSIANSEVNPSFCEEVRNRIKGNLETAGFSCQ